MLNHCRTCTTLFAVGLTACPHCGADLEEGMAKITVHGGPSNAAAGEGPTPKEEVVTEPEETPTEGTAEPEEVAGETPAEEEEEAAEETAESDDNPVF